MAMLIAMAMASLYDVCMYTPPNNHKLLQREKLLYSPQPDLRPSLHFKILPLTSPYKPGTKVLVKHNFLNLTCILCWFDLITVYHYYVCELCTKGWLPTSNVDSGEYWYCWKGKYHHPIYAMRIASSDWWIGRLKTHSTTQEKTSQLSNVRLP